MLKLLEKLFPARLRQNLTNRAWIFVLLAILFSVAVRVRLRDMPLERDEGEYAYAGQLLLEGVPPYKEAYNMKLPGTYLAYAASMAVFGQTPTGIHLGLAIVNAATIWLMFLLGRKLLDPAAGAVAAVTYALMSLSPDVLGLAGHATHYVVLPAVGGILVLLSALEQRSRWRHFAAGLLFGLAFVMKQHGVFFGVFGGVYLIWVRWAAVKFGTGDGGLGTKRFPRRRASGSRRMANEDALDWVGLVKELAVYSAGCLLPYLFTCLWLWAAGVFPDFWFWTVSYGSKYASSVPLVKASDLTSAMLRAVVGPNLIFWLLPWVGMLMMWWDERLDREYRFLLSALFGFSVLAISVGFYFREHYFILLLPVLSLLIAVAVSRSLQLLQGDQSIELFLALGVVVVTAVAAGAVLFGNGAVWLTKAPATVVEDIYGTSVFADARSAAGIVAAETKPETRIAVLGSEPEIFFYARRRSAFGHIYMYPLMETHPYAAKLQVDVIAQIERVQPDYVIYVNQPFSWLWRPESETKLLDWWPRYWEKNYSLVQTITTRDGDSRSAPAAATSDSYLLILKRKSAPGGAAP